MSETNEPLVGSADIGRASPPFPPERPEVEPGRV
jgi:hypothetical protein